MENKFKKNRLIHIENQDINYDTETILRGNRIYSSLARANHFANVINSSTWMTHFQDEAESRLMTKGILTSTSRRKALDVKRCLNYNAWVKGLTVLEDSEQRTLREIENNAYLRRIAEGIERLNDTLSHIADNIDEVIDSPENYKELLENYSEEESDD